MSQPANPCKTNGLWFEDGNIVLQAGNTLFKLYRGILIRESNVFEDMLSLPQPNVHLTNEDTYEGCQLVKMHDDEVDLGRFLNALFDFEYLGNVDECRIYAAILRMTTKYQADALRKRVVQILRYVYPDTLKAWDEVRNAGDSFPSSHPLHNIWLDDFQDDVAVINAARDAEAQILLPAAMLRIFMIGVHDILKGEEAVELDDVNRDAILAAQPALAKLSRRQTFSVLYNDDLSISPQCRSRESCYKNGRKFLSRMEHANLGYIIEPFTQVSFAPGKISYNFCSECRIAFKTSYENGREAAWQEVPKAFGLPSWEEMRKAVKDEGDEDAVMEQDDGGNVAN